jgi:hypothetical protein
LQADPLTARRWLIRNEVLLRELHNGTISLDHATLDSLPNPKSVEYIRSLLVGSGILEPDVHRGVRRLEAELPELLTALDTGHRTLTNRWFNWVVLPRLPPTPRHPKREDNSDKSFDSCLGSNRGGWCCTSAPSTTSTLGSPTRQRRGGAPDPS